MHQRQQFQLVNHIHPCAFLLPLTKTISPHVCYFLEYRSDSDPVPRTEKNTHHNIPKANGPLIIDKHSSLRPYQQLFLPSTSRPLPHQTPRRQGKSCSTIPCANAKPATPLLAKLQLRLPFPPLPIPVQPGKLHPSYTSPRKSRYKLSNTSHVDSHEYSGTSYIDKMIFSITCQVIRIPHFYKYGEMRWDRIIRQAQNRKARSRRATRLFFCACSFSPGPRCACKL